MISEETLITDINSPYSCHIFAARLRGDDGRHTHRLAQVLKVGKHKLELLIVNPGEKLDSGIGRIL
jgi:hypothetical protein